MSQAIGESITAKPNRKPDRTAAARQARYRERKRLALAPQWRNAAVTNVTPPPIQARVTVLPPDNQTDSTVPLIGRALIGLTLIGAALFVAYTSMRANAWLGYAMSIDDNAGHIFAGLTVTAELIALVLPVTAALYTQMGDRWPAILCWLMAPIVCAVVFFAASGFVLRGSCSSEHVRLSVAASPP